MGRTVRAGQIFVSTMEADPPETDIITGVTSIEAGEIDADEVVVDRIGISNANPTQAFSLGSDLYMNPGQEIVVDSNKTMRSARLLVTDKIGVRVENPLNDFQIGESANIFMSLENRDIVTVRGNVATTALLASDVVKVGEVFTVDT